METKDTGKKSSERMTRTQKVIVILTAAILTIILIAVATTRYMGSPGVYPIEADQGTSSSEENAVPSEKDTSYSQNDTANSEKGTSDSDSTGIGGTEAVIPAIIIVIPAAMDKTHRPKPEMVISIPVRIRTTQGQIRHQARIRKSRMMIQEAVKMIPHQAEFPPEML